MKIYFVRHAESMGNANGDYSTDAHDQLSPLGNTQALKLARRLEHFYFEKIFCSPYQRAMDTIAPHLEQSNQTAQILTTLGEACWQEDKNEIPQKNRIPKQPIKIPKHLQPFFKISPQDNLLPIAEETYSEGLQRIKTLNYFIKECSTKEYESILFVGHHFTNSMSIELLLGLEPLQKIDHSNTGLSCLKFSKEKGFEINFINRL